MDQKTVIGTEDRALSALNAITRDDSDAAREHIRGLGFQGRALLAAWAEELGRLTRDEQNDYELAERRAARERREAEATSRRALRIRIGFLYAESGSDAPVVDAADFDEIRQSRDWKVAELKQLCEDGVLKPDAGVPGRYTVLMAPGGGNA